MAEPPPDKGATTRALAPLIAPISRDDANATLRAAQEPDTTLFLNVPGGGTLVEARVRTGRSRITYGRDHIVLFIDGLRPLDGLTRTEWRVLAAILPLTAYGDNIAPVRASSIAQVIGIDRAHAAAAIRRLRDANILVAYGVPGERLPFYRLSRRIAWRGSAMGYRTAQKEEPDLPIKLPARKPRERSAAKQGRGR